MPGVRSRDRGPRERTGLSPHQNPDIMAYMPSKNPANETSAPNPARAPHGRRKELPDTTRAFTPAAPLGWGTQLNYAAIILATAAFVAPQILLHPTIFGALPIATYFTSGIAIRRLNRRANLARFRRWARRHHTLRLTTAEARDLLDGGATATHQGTLHGTHLHLTELPVAAAPQEAPAIEAPSGNPVPVIV